MLCLGWLWERRSFHSFRMSGPLYRARQFFEAVFAWRLDEDELRLAREYLPNRAFELFQTMPLGDQRHSLTILRTLLAQGYREAPLLQAALLHDVAKARVGLWHRTVVILLNAVSKNLLPRLASPDPRSWRYPFYLSQHHPELGAEAAARVGIDPLAATLIRQHQLPLPPHSNDHEPARPAERDLTEWRRVLKAIDDQN
jgi:hypothetical protein